MSHGSFFLLSKTMEALSSLSPPLLSPCSNNNCPTTSQLVGFNPSVRLIRSKSNHAIKLRQSNLDVRVKALDDVSATVGDPAQAQLTWQIIVGSLAGVTPFIVAGIEFSKRIVAQRRCEVCGGSGLVLRDKKYYFRCPGCGGFLPWQSWKRFFSG